MDASLPVLDRFVDQRVDSMIDAGLLDEVYKIFSRNADYTRGFRQAIGVREFESFLSLYITEASDKGNHLIDGSMSLKSVDLAHKILKENMRLILNSLIDSQPNSVLKEAIEKVKLNTRRLVRRQVSYFCKYVYLNSDAKMLLNHFCTFHKSVSTLETFLWLKFPKHWISVQYVEPSMVNELGLLGL